MSEEFSTSPNAETVLNELFQRYPRLKICEYDIRFATSAVIHTFSLGGTLLTCGNGGSSSDAGHLAGELMKSFEQNRPVNKELEEKLSERFGEQGRYLAKKLQDSLPVISLSAHESLITAIANDTDPDLIFAQQVVAHSAHANTLLAISTSGNSQNIINAIITAKAVGLVTIGLTGESGGKMKDLCDIIIRVPETRTSFVQELHLPVYHAICMMVEDYFIHHRERGEL